LLNYIYPDVKPKISI